jgi:arylsulfatase A-like enzyme
MMRTLLAALAVAAVCPAASAVDRPNIVWIFVDDMSADFGCYGRKIATPHVDKLAARGTRFTNAYVTAPVCSPCRSALITGMYQTTIGAHHHRSGRGVEKIRLPAGVEPVPALFRKAGYHTSITGWPVAEGKPAARGKTDYNFVWDPGIYDGNDWRGRRPGQPFFCQVQLHGGKHREGRGGLPERIRTALGTLTKPEDVTLPPYYPDDPLIRADWAAYLDTCRFTDHEVGEILARLDADGLTGDTVVFFMTDHGISHARGKQFLYNEGTHVPFVIAGPGIAAGATRTDLVEHIDMAATSLALAGIPVPAAMQGRDILGKDYKPREAVFAARDRCDETVDHIRSVRTARWLYVRNYLPKRPHLQPNAYKDGKPILKRLRELHEAGKLPELCEQLLFAPERPAEELYDVAADPHQIRNLAADPAYAETLREMRARLEKWEIDTDDKGRNPEPAAMFDSDMAVYLKGRGGNDVIRRNIELMKRWAAEGK